MMTTSASNDMTGSMFGEVWLIQGCSAHSYVVWKTFLNQGFQSWNGTPQAPERLLSKVGLSAAISS
jgi:hypothetical protein